MSIGAILKMKGSNLFTIAPEHTVGDVANVLTINKIGAVVVCDTKNKMVGLVSERDLVEGMSRYGGAVLGMQVRNIMSSKVISCKASDSVKQAQELMNSKRIRHLPVLNGDELVGVISIRDVVAYMLQVTQMEAGVLRDYAIATR